MPCTYMSKKYFYLVTYYIEWATSSWTYSTYIRNRSIFTELTEQANTEIEAYELVQITKKKTIQICLY